MLDLEAADAYNDPMLRDFLLTAYHSQIFHPQSTRDMLSFDLMQWVVNIIDAHLTGQINGAAWRQQNPKAKNKIKAFADGDSFAKHVMPPRLKTFYQEAGKSEPKLTEKQKFDQKSGEFFDRLRKNSAQA